MTRRSLAILLSVAVAACGERRPAPPATDTSATGTSAAAPAPALRIVATIGDTASTVEGLAEYRGALYTADWKDGGVYRIDSVGSVTRVGQLPLKPGTSILGLAADSSGNLYAAVPDEGVIYRIAAARLGASDFNALKDARKFVTGAGRQRPQPRQGRPSLDLGRRPERRLPRTALGRRRQRVRERLRHRLDRHHDAGARLRHQRARHRFPGRRLHRQHRHR